MDYTSDMKTYPSAGQDRATVTAAFDGYEKLLCVLDETLDQHRARLCLLLTPEEPAPGGAGDALHSGRPCSDIVSRIESLNERLHRLTNQLANVTARVEL